MNFLFESLWNGNIAPCETCGSHDGEVQELEQLIDKNREALQQSLNDRQKTLLESYIACQEEYSYCVTVHAFRDGFSLACKLLTDALQA